MKRHHESGVFSWLDGLEESGDALRSFSEVVSTPPFDKLMVSDREIGECPEFIEGQNSNMSYSTYIVLCDNNKYYVGHSQNPDLRFLRHLSKDGAKFTKQNQPKKLLWHQEFDTEIEAIRREKQIKGWTRKKKENLINGTWI